MSSFLFRFFADAAVQLEASEGFTLAAGSFPDSMRSAVAKFHREPASGIQYFSKAQDGAVVGQPERHMAADLQVCVFGMLVSAISKHAQRRGKVPQGARLRHPVLQQGPGRCCRGTARAPHGCRPAGVHVWNACL